MNRLELKELVWRANLDLVKHNLVILTWGNVSGYDRNEGIMAIKPSGMSYEEIMPEDIVIVDLEGKVIEGALNPSSDTPTHLELYTSLEAISAVAHTHSEYATMFAQANREIPCLGTTHADYFNGPVPVTRLISAREVESDYERNTGKVIIERFSGLNPLEMPAVLVAGHGPFTWGRTPDEAVKNCVALEKVAKMAWGTLFLNPQCDQVPEYLRQKHHQRRHGPDAYYGQKKRSKE
ncbi:MAG: L-ribulose-5-phosphate 4-epimerase AraD [Candidatus Aminicenantes bacterium]|nr:L-ribulose-5-phosphate 4-epimerase AraD [Candidatus Aminicenantes bacterium]MDH5706775.1 L-ribulose-5-phosphate 4-epimerase AraD [Candidatus Aminicenantes bacterium]